MKPLALGSLTLLACASIAMAADTTSTSSTKPAAKPAAHAKSSEHAKIKNITPDELSKLLADGKAVAVDANGSETREKFGTVPNAKLLTSASTYATDSELPSDKGQMLVFYCANPKCTASETAAQRAVKAGYTKVAVMKAGISGWKDAGKDTTPAPKS